MPAATSRFIHSSGDGVSQSGRELPSPFRCSVAKMSMEGSGISHGASSGVSTSTKPASSKNPRTHRFSRARHRSSDRPS